MGNLNHKTYSSRSWYDHRQATRGISVAHKHKPLQHGCNDPVVHEVTAQYCVHSSHIEVSTSAWSVFLTWPRKAQTIRANVAYAWSYRYQMGIGNHAMELLKRIYSFHLDRRNYRFCISWHWITLDSSKWMCDRRCLECFKSTLVRCVSASTYTDPRVFHRTYHVDLSFVEVSHIKYTHPYD